LKGEYAERQAETSRNAETYEQAADWYQKAIDRDPNFALAIARLAENRTVRHWLFDRLGEVELGRIREMAQRALAIAPNLAEAHIALGLFYYLGQLNYDEALPKFQRAQELQPNNVRAMRFMASVHSRQGQWQRSLSEYEQCERLDPLDPTLPGNIGAIYNILRMWKEAARASARALALDPHSDLGMRALMFSCLNGRGDVEEGMRILATFPPGAVLSTNSWWLPAIIGDATYVYVIKRDFGAALKAWDKESSDPIANRQRLSARIAIHVLAGDAAVVRDEAEKARGLVEARVRERPDDKNALIQLSWIYLALNRGSQACAAFGGIIAAGERCNRRHGSSRRARGNRSTHRSYERSSQDTSTAPLHSRWNFNHASEDRSRVGPDPQRSWLSTTPRRNRACWTIASSSSSTRATFSPS
jgi:tetratricopeptide (TPR) repeat protein